MIVDGFRQVRRKDRALSTERAWEILARAEWGVLSTTGEDGWPYGVPVNHVVVDGALYLHCAQKGHKLDNLERDARACFTVVTADAVRQADLSTAYESAIAFGRARRVASDEEKARALDALIQRLAPENTEGPARDMKSYARTVVLRLDPEHVTGKANR